MENVLLADLENTFDGLSRKVFCFTLRREGVPEYLVNAVLSLYKDFKFICHESRCPSRAPLESTFILTKNVSRGSLMELLYADDLVLCRETLNEVMGKYGRLENVVEGKGLRVNVDKTKGMQLLFRNNSIASKMDL